MYPDIDFYPDSLISSRDEPFYIEQNLVQKIENSGEEPLILHNDQGASSFDFKPIESAEPIRGLTMLYLVFPLGEEKGDFSAKSLFDQIRFSLPENLLSQKVGDDTIVIYPSSTITLEQMDMLEVVMSHVVSTGDTEEMVLVKTAFFDADSEVFAGRRALYRKSHPLAIAGFSLADACRGFGFRDKLTFSYAVLGAEQSILTPGDVALPSACTADPLPEKAASPGMALPQAGAAAAGAYETDTVIYRNTVYGINAFRGGDMVSASLECVLKRASIVSFRGSYTVNQDKTRNVTLYIEVENTRHAYLNNIGRIELEPGKTLTLGLQNQEADATYRLTVENEDGLSWKNVEWKSK